MLRGKRKLTLAFALLLLLVPLLGASDAAAKRVVPRGFYGINYSGNYELAPDNVQSQLWDKLAAGGAESTRVLFNWDLAEQDPGHPDWRRIDPLVIRAARRGMDILATIEYAPNWAKAYPGVTQSPPNGTANYTAFLAKLVQRYGPNGSFWGGKTHRRDIPYLPVRRWAVWNEPEISFHWYRYPKGRKWGVSDAKQYANLLVASYDTIHRLDPGAQVVMAALSINSWKNLQLFYDNTPIKNHFDVAALQGYVGKPSYLPQLLSNFRATLDKNGAGNLPMFIDEITWPAAKGKAHPPYTTGYMSDFLTDQKGAATRLSNAYSLLRAKRAKWNLQRVFWYQAESSYTGEFEYDYSGLFTFQNNDQLRALPVYNAYAKSARSAEGCAKKSSGACK